MFKAIFFDLETLRLSFEVGGWKNKMAMGVSVLAIYKEWDKSWEVFLEDDFQSEEKKARILQLFNEADVICGHNVLSFDFRVLEGSLSKDLRYLAPKVIDFAHTLFFKFRFRCSLSNISKRTCGFKRHPKILDGVKAVEYWRSGEPRKRALVIEYCKRDVELCYFVYWVMVYHDTVWKKGHAVGGRIHFYNGAEASKRRETGQVGGRLFSTCIINYPFSLDQYLTSNREEIFGPKVKKPAQYTFQREGMDLKSMRRIVSGEERIARRQLELTLVGV